MNSPSCQHPLEARFNVEKRAPIPLLTGSLWSLFTQMSAYLVTIAVIVAARILGSEDFGYFSFALAVTLMLTPLTDFGTSTYAAIMMARHTVRLTELLDNVLGVRLLVASLYVAICTGITMLIVEQPGVVLLAVVLALDNVVRQLALTFHFAFRAEGLFPLETWTNLVERVAIAALMTVVLLSHPTFLAVGIAFLLGRCCGLATAAVSYTRRFCMPRPRLALHTWRELFRQGSPLGLRAIFAWLLWQVDVVILGAFRPAAEVGWYAAAYQLLRGVRIIPDVLCNPLGPAISQAYGARGLDGALALFHRSLKYLLIAALPLAVYTSMLASPIITTLYGAKYQPAAAALQLLIWATVFIFATQAAYTFLDNVDRRRFTVWVFGISLALNVGLNLLLIPRYGYMAAAATTVLSEGAAFALFYGFMIREKWNAPLGRVLAGSSVAALLSASLLLLAGDNFFVAIPLGLFAFAAYLLLLWMLGVWERDELQRAQAAWIALCWWRRPGLRDV
jgi:O-antigen/teichoic acid export membrane protein